MHQARRHCVHSGTSGRLASTTTDDIDALVARLKDRPRVVLHFHGGLVDDALGFVTAERLAPVYEAAGAEPVFFVWSSGLLEVLRGNLPQILSEGVFQTLLNRVVRFASGVVFPQPGSRALGGFTAPSTRAVARELALLRTGQEPYARLTPPAEVPAMSEAERVRITADLAADTELAERNREIVGSVLRSAPATTAARDIDGGRAAVATLMSPDTVAELAAETADAENRRAVVTSALLVRKTVRVVSAVVARFRHRTDHGLYPTVVEEILREFYLANVGAAVWDAMKRQTADTFAAAAEPRAGHYFLDRFGRLLASGSRPRVTLVGHSAGAVFIGNLLTDLARRRADADDPLPEDFRVQDVVLLAPACTVGHLAGMVRRQTELFDRLRMFTMTDAAERADQLVPFLYPRSLLYFVSGVLERGPEGETAVSPLAGMQRWFTAEDDTGGADARDLRAFLRADATRTVWSPVDGGPGLTSGARSHAGFDDDPEVLASLARMLAD
ncbi:hypothetical protein [Streptomyces spectabilis]|uniref:Alpha/beta hydrolase n=1 Tax=Streptomyces spectabilis TaxID=68270 RepID=A0A5P2XGX1_STRST|nr:hypothetical protein [Streptomyces spectabilis]MBB5101878.1 hypothetical protein [Streptomyces spectabilis]MCI3906930.1 hypothetical protein [Streptomyces spectabilis]QEV63718.1 hypothetical protein CP982_37635 [Streptomyces spectabilis]GGV34800.1 hypothetical protein GCM10010245_55870 [Streptomyces spectabilis]